MFIGTIGTIGRVAGATGVAGTPWNPNSKSAGMGTSTDNYIATNNTTGAQSIDGLNFRDGKYYIEFKIVSKVAFISIGMRNAAGAQIAHPRSNGTASSSIGYSSGGAIIYNDPGAANPTQAPAFTTGDVIGVAVTTSTGAIDWYFNGSLATSTTAGPTGPLIPSFFSNGSAGSGDSVKLQTATGSLTYAPPSGYTAWN